MSNAFHEVSWVILAGPARSGTTYLRELISTHPRAALFHEYGLQRLWRSLETLRPARAKEAPAAIWNSDGEARHSAPSDLGRNELAQGLYERIFQRSGLTLLGDKMALGANTPIPTPPAGFAGKLRYVLLLRRPSCVMASSLARKDRAISGEDDWPVGSLEEAALQLMGAWRAMRTVAQDSEVKCMIVKYEDVLKSPAETIASIFEFLDLSPLTDTLAVKGRTAPVPVEWDRLSAFPHLRWLEENWDRFSGDELLAQSEMPLMLPFDRELRFDNIGSMEVLQSGFSLPEPHGTWTNGPLAVLALTHPATDHAMAVHLTVSAAHTSASRPCIVDVTINDATPHRLELPNAFGVHRILLSTDHFRKDRGLVLKLNILHPKALDEAPVSEPRQLGLAISAIRLEKIEPD
jgi:hypothetical protein